MQCWCLKCPVLRNSYFILCLNEGSGVRAAGKNHSSGLWELNCLWTENCTAPFTPNASKRKALMPSPSTSELTEVSWGSALKTLISADLFLLFMPDTPENLLPGSLFCSESLSAGPASLRLAKMWVIIGNIRSAWSVHMVLFQVHNVLMDISSP